MSKQIFSSTPDLSSDAAFRAWGSALSGALQVLFVKVTQAGEINWTTVSKPATSGASAGFEVYRLNDSLQATVPIFFKIEYGAYAGGTIRPCMWMTVGKGADGSGTITSELFSRSVIAGGNNIWTASAKDSYLGNGDGSCLVLSMWPSDTGSQAGAGQVLVLERSRDDNGNPTGVGVFWSRTVDGNYHAVEVIDYTTMTKSSTPFSCIPIPYQTSSGVGLSNGVNTPVFTGSCLTVQREAWVPTTLLGVARADFGVGVVATAIYSSVDYLALGAAASYSDMAKQQYSSVLIRWD